jgi:hypothetical protein
MKVTCEYCGVDIEKATGHVNRARKLGMGLFCDRVCFGLHKRVDRTDEEKKKIKYEYDKKRRAELKDILKQKQKAYNESPAGRAMQKRHREKRKEFHKEYIKSDRYRAWKKNYDEKYHAKKNYGEFFEAAIVLKRIEEVILPEKQESKIQKGTYNKSQKRKRQWNSLQQTLKRHFGTPYNQ